MSKINFPTLTKDQVEVRVGNTKKDRDGKTVLGFSLLLYKDARVDANILDETVGQFNWQKRYYELKGNIYCSLGIYFEDRKEWVWKDDCGAESQTEKEKGEASDAFKRAGFAWGIGRELYNSPFVWVTCNDKINQFTRFKVVDMEIDKATKEFKKLVVTTDDREETVVFSMGVAKKSSFEPTPKPKINVDDDGVVLNKEKGSATETQKQIINSYIEKLRTYETREKFFVLMDKEYGTSSIDILSEEQADNLVNRITSKQRQR